jgi:two-component system nitrogen regulation sensor histidine kinase GlnL
VCERVRSLILAEFPKRLDFVRDHDTSIPDFLGDRREQLIQAVLNVAHNAARTSVIALPLVTHKSSSRRGLPGKTFGKQRYRLALESCH